MSGLFDQFTSWYENRHDYAMAWKRRTGGQVVAALCAPTPEEVLIAAGMLPVRVPGAHVSHDVTGSQLFGTFSPFSRDALAQGLLGHYDYCTGVALTQSCIQPCQTFNSWRMQMPAVTWDYCLSMPNGVHSEPARLQHYFEVKKFRTFLEGVVGKPITDAALRRSAELVDENRRLLHELHAYRKQTNPRVTGVDALYASVTAQFIDKEDHNRELRRVLAALPKRPQYRAEGVRFLTIGSEIQDVSLMAAVESCGATIVIDDQYSGSRNFWGAARVQDDPIATIADCYYDPPACSVRNGATHVRRDRVLKLAKDYNARAAIFLQQKFCDRHEGDYPDLKEHLEKNGIPTLFLECGTSNPIGPLRIRIEAFLETMSEEALF